MPLIMIVLDLPDMHDMYERLGRGGSTVAVLQALLMEPHMRPIAHIHEIRAAVHDGLLRRSTTSFHLACLAGASGLMHAQARRPLELPDLQGTIQVIKEMAIKMEKTDSEQDLVFVSDPALLPRPPAKIVPTPARTAASPRPRAAYHRE